MYRGLFTALISVGVAAFLGGCGGGETQVTPPTTTVQVSDLQLSSDKVSIKTDNTDFATITATVMGPGNVAVSGATVLFSAAAGQLGVSSGPSGTDGKVTITYSAGSDRFNRTEVITATVQGTSLSPSQIPIQVTGSTMTLTPSSTIAQVGGTAPTLAVSAKDSSGVGVANQTIRFSIPAGNGTLSGGSGSSDTAISQTTLTSNSGVTPNITYTPAVAGDVVVTSDWLDGKGNVTLSKTTTISVTAPGIAYTVTMPTTDPTSIQLGNTQVVTVSVPSSISGKTVANVRFATSLGTWSNGSKVITKAPVANSVTDTFSAGASSGIANIQIDALDAAANVLATLSRTFALSASVSSATQITLQASVTNVPPSSAGTTNTATLTATVRDVSGNTVGSAPVLFEITNPTGSGEQVTPVLVNTDSSGKAVSTFTSGDQSTTGGLVLKASVVGTTISDTETIYVNASGVSVSLGASSTISSVNNNTNYKLPMSVLVVDNAGAAVQGALVTLSAFPTNYFRGTRGAKCAVTYTGGPMPNEDVNENDVLDPGEDSTGDGFTVLDGKITPPHSTAGSVPTTVTTDQSGVAEFDLIFQKQYASWIESRIRAKVVVSGTESTNELKFILPIAAADAIDPCPLPDSPAGW